MRKLALSALAALVCAAAALPAAAVTPPGGRPGIAPGDENCSVTVVFGSYAMGIDGDSYARVERYLKRHRPAVTYSSSNWGREGERTVCVTTRSARVTRKVFNDIRGMHPHVSRRGPVEVRSNLGQTYQTRNPGERR